MTGIVVCLAVLAAATAYGLAHRARAGRLRVRRAEPRGDAPRPDTLTSADLGRELGERATLVQFSTAFCRPCVATRRVLGDVAAMVDGVVHVDIDAESRLDLVRRLGVLRTPTVLVLDPAGAVVRRGSGAPRRADVIAALGVAVDGPGVAG